MYKHRIALIDGNSGKHWMQLLRSCCAECDAHLMTIQESLIPNRCFPKIDLILLDASSVTNIHTVIKNLLSLDSRHKIVVITSSPHWREARDAYRMGAFDYITKSLDCNGIKKMLKLLEK